MSVLELETLLEHRHGVRLDELTTARLGRLLADEARASGSTPDGAARELLADPVRLQGLVDRITLQETAFFRDPDVFADLAAHLLPAALAAPAAGPPVLWSAGCANGQEAWSLAMLLVEHGVPDFEVVATDLSARAAARAAAGVYDERELRGLDADRRARFLVREGERWRVADGLRRHVRVVHHNSATQPPPVADGSCALVLCRYVLIYLTPAASDALLERIATALRPEGRLLIGAAESLWHLSERFAVEPLPHAVAYRDRAREATVPPRAPRPPAARPAVPVVRAERRGPSAPLPARAAVSAPAPAALPRGAELVRAGEAAAARGELQEAATAFRGAVYLDPDDAVALLRLGLVLEALGDPGALRAFRAARGALDRRPRDRLDDALGGYGPAALDALLAEKLELRA